MMSSARNAAKAALQYLYTPKRFLWRLPGDAPHVALTFDDGPDPVHTPAILDMLAEAGIKATFFLIGEKAEHHPDLVRRIVQEGHGIGGHTVGHQEIVSLTPAQLAFQLARCRQIIRDASGHDSVLFRPPRGKVDQASIYRVCKSGYCLVHWTKTYSDYHQDGTAPLMARMKKDPPAPRDIILLHDHNMHTRDALAALIPEWSRLGLTFTALSG